jgi:transcriptional regulator GlxA family with amidase domain
MTRQELLSLAAARVASSGIASFGVTSIAKASQDVPRLPLPPGPVRVAFVVGAHNVALDIVGPWEVFKGATFVGEMDGMQPPNMPWPKNRGFKLTTVTDSVTPLDAEGLTIAARYSFDDYPGQPNVIVIGEQGDPSAAKIAWIRRAGRHADVVMSVCTGAFCLALTGLLDGLRATTHHDGYEMLAQQFPHIHVERNIRFVDNGQTSTSGGITSGIDLALHIVGRYYGEAVALATAYWMEYNRNTPRPMA